MKNLMLDEVIEQLQEAKRTYGNIPVYIDIENDDTIYEAKDILSDEDSVTIYTY